MLPVTDGVPRERRVSRAVLREAICDRSDIYQENAVCAHEGVPSVSSESDGIDSDSVAPRSMLPIGRVGYKPRPQKEHLTSLSHQPMRR